MPVAQAAPWLPASPPSLADVQRHVAPHQPAPPLPQAADKLGDAEQRRAYDADMAAAQFESNMPRWVDAGVWEGAERSGVGVGWMGWGAGGRVGRPHRACALMFPAQWLSVSVAPAPVGGSRLAVSVAPSWALRLPFDPTVLPWCRPCGLSLTPLTLPPRAAATVCPLQYVP